ncbi:MAG: right-handed parallel beta-helix repeat-containing protein, partial [Candidatus Heimdallarchaeaceae archaeon]
MKIVKLSKIRLSKVKVVIIVLIISFLFTSNVRNSTKDTSFVSAYIEHSAISITDDSGFSAFPGTGTEIDPYLIDGYNITTTSSMGIYISGTTKHFTIKNCYLNASNYGIYIDTVAEGTTTAINNTCSKNTEDGIRLDYSDGSTLADNNCSNNGYNGLHLYESGSATLTNNTCSNTGLYGIILVSSDNSTLTNNTCSDNFDGEGIYLSSSGDSTLTNNTCSDNIFGIRLDYSGSSTLTNNTCYNNMVGIRLR